MKRETKYREKYRENPEENQYVDKVCFSPEYVCSFMFDDCKYEKLLLPSILFLPSGQVRRARKV
jgi:hypothetical protein